MRDADAAAGADQETVDLSHAINTLQVSVLVR